MRPPGPSDCEIRIVFPSRRDARARARAVVETLLASGPFAADEVAEILIAISESLANVARHAYAGAQLRVELRVALTQEGLVAEVRDRGAPVAPDRIAIGRPRQRDAREGGRGLWLITRTMDAVEYRRVAGENVLRLERWSAPARRRRAREAAAGKRKVQVGAAARR